MNRLSELQTIVRVANLCNKNGLIKEADQLLNIFTKLAQENPEAEDMPETEPAESAETPEQETPIEEELNDQLLEYHISFNQLMQDLNDAQTFKESQNILPELIKIIDLARIILNNPNVESENKNILSEMLPQLVTLQETLTK